MTNEQKLREIAEKWGFSQYKTDEGFLIDNDRTKECLSDLTALISEHYYPKEKYDELLRQRDELKEALINVTAIIKDCYPLLFDNEKPIIKQAEAAIKNTDG